MLIAAYLLSVSGMIVLPLLLAFYLVRKFKLSWKLVLAGALTFIASQILHIPVVYALTALFRGGVISIPATWTLPFNAVILGLLAGIFEETARWVLYKFILKDAKTWNEGVLVGVGHGGVEAVLLGFVALASIVSMIAMRNVDLSTLGIPADQIELAKQQVTDFWSAPMYMAFLGLIERVFAVSLHLSLSMMVLYSVAYKKPSWFWIAILWHAIVDALAVYLMPTLGTLGIEAVVGVCAIISLIILLRMKALFVHSPVNDVPLIEQLPS